MDEKYNKKYQRILTILSDVAKCTQGKFILVGGTALAVFYLKHRVSVDLDFVPISGNDVTLKNELKGCLSSKGYRTSVGAFKNQFIVQFEDTSIKIEVFEPEVKIKRTEEHELGAVKILTPTLDELFEMKVYTYKQRKESRDLFDIFYILKVKKSSLEEVKNLVSEVGIPKNIEEIDKMAINQKDVIEFKKLISNVTPKTSN